MRIAVISDTHDRYPEGVPDLVRGVDEIWHLGDVCDPATLVEFERLGVPLHVVLGNNDDHPAWPVALNLTRGVTRFHLVHIAPPRAPAGAQVVLHGHTHVPRDATDVSGVRWLNPGCLTRPRGGVRSFAWLTIGTDGRYTWTLVPL